MGLFGLFRRKRVAPPTPPPPPPVEFTTNDALGTEYRTTVQNGIVQRQTVRLSQASQANVDAAQTGANTLINQLGENDFVRQTKRDVRQNQLFQNTYGTLLDFYNQQASRTRAANAKRLGAASTNTFLGQQLLGLQQQTTKGINDGYLNAFNQAWSEQTQQDNTNQSRLNGLNNVLNFYQSSVLPYTQMGSANSADSRRLQLAQYDSLNRSINAQNASYAQETRDTQKAILDGFNTAALFF
jgi:hypothetical protein